MPTTVQIYEGKTTNIKVSQSPVLKVWQNDLSGLWHVPLTAQQTNQEC